MNNLQCFILLSYLLLILLVYIDEDEVGQEKYGMAI